MFANCIVNTSKVTVVMKLLKLQDEKYTTIDINVVYKFKFYNVLNGMMNTCKLVMLAKRTECVGV